MIRNGFLVNVACVLTVFFLSGCATIIEGTNSTVYVKTGYKDAKVSYRDRFGHPTFVGAGDTVPVSVNKKDLDKNLIEVSRDSCKTVSTVVVGRFDEMSLINILTLGTGFAVDAISGAIKTPDSTQINLSPVCS